MQKFSSYIVTYLLWGFTIWKHFECAQFLPILWSYFYLKNYEFYRFTNLCNLWAGVNLGRFDDFVGSFLKNGPHFFKHKFLFLNWKSLFSSVKMVQLFLFLQARSRWGSSWTTSACTCRGTPTRSSARARRWRRPTSSTWTRISSIGQRRTGRRRAIIRHSLVRLINVFTQPGVDVINKF